MKVVEPKSTGLKMSPKSGGGGGIYRTIGWRHFIYGGVASCVAECGTFPLDLTKTRLQIQGQQAKHLISCGISPVRSTYRGTLDALVKISREEGLVALYRGISPALLRQSVYGTLKFGAYYSLKKFLPDEHLASNILCAVVAGMVSSAIANPTDVLKVRMQVASANPSHSSVSLYSAFKKIYMFEGIAGLWRGVGPTSQRAGIIAAVELPVYDGFKRYFIQHNILEDAPPNHIISSLIASLAAAVASTPIDVIRTRLMSQKLVQTDSYGREAFPDASRLLPHSGKVYRGSWECLVTTVKHEGVMALYKGFVPAWVRMGPWNLLFFTTYEQLLRYF